MVRRVTAAFSYFLNISFFFFLFYTLSIFVFLATFDINVLYDNTTDDQAKYIYILYIYEYRRVISTRA